MYIAKFGGSWLDHPFWFSRFVVKPADVARINQAEIPSVVIDDEKGIGPDTPRVPEPKAAEPTPITVVPKPARPSHGVDRCSNPGGARAIVNALRNSSPNRW